LGRGFGSSQVEAQQPPAQGAKGAIEILSVGLGNEETLRMRESFMFCWVEGVEVTVMVL